MSSPTSIAISAHSEHARLEREIEDLSEEILERYEEVNILYRLCDSFRDIFDEPEILERLLREAALSVRASAGWIALVDLAESGDSPTISSPVNGHGETARLELAVVTAGQDVSSSAAALGALRWIEGTYGQGPGSDQTPARAPASAETLALRSIRENRMLSVERERGSRDRHAHFLAVPLPGRNEPIGALVLEKLDTEAPFRSGDSRLVAAVAAVGASIVENRRLARRMKEAERVKGEIEIARQIQQGLLPSSDPSVVGLQIAGVCRPAQDIGGDYFGYSNIAPGRFGITIADVSGHSVGAAIGMVMARCLIQSEAHQSDSPSRIASRVNELLNRDLTDPGMFVTAFLVVYEERTGRFSYTNAGHNPPLLYRSATGTSEPLAGASLGLGILSGTRYFDRVETLHPGDRLVLYTDGLTEARSPAGEMFGAERLKSAVASCSAMSARESVEAIIEHVVSWRGSPDFLDDLTLVVARKD